MAACLIASLPIAFMYNLFLDRFIAGFTVGLSSSKRYAKCQTKGFVFLS
jgi:hypothetical protein